MIEITTLASGSKGNAYRVTDSMTPLLLECGINYRDIQKGFGFQMSIIAGCLISHEHNDHSKCVKDILKASIDCYMSSGTASAIGIEHHRLKIVESKKQFKIGTWVVLPFDTQHDSANPLGFLLINQIGERLLFITDSYYCKYKFTGLNYIMIECNYSMKILNENIANGTVPKVMKKRLMKSHFSLENVKEFLKANDLSKVQEIHLLHLSDTNSNANEFKREIQELTGKMVYIA